MTNRNNGGFTLIELILSIAIASLITMAALSLMLMGLRINVQTSTNVKQQNTTAMLAEILQNVAEEKDIMLLPTQHGYQITNGTEEDSLVFVEYKKDSGIIELREEPFMENVEDFEVTLTNNTLLTIELTVNGSEYTAAAYCRLNTPSPEAGENTNQGGNS